MERDSVDMDETKDTYFDEPDVSSNNLGDILNWLKQGDHVVLYSNNYNKTTWHDCNKQANTITKNRVININVGRWSCLLNDDEWFWYLKDRGYQKCNCDKKESDKIYYYRMNH